MGTVKERHIDMARGTPEAAWRACRWLREAPQVCAQALLPPNARAVVVAPHPDDEVLAAGGLVAQWVRAGRDVLVIAVTDGDASHPGSRRWPAAALAAERASEQARALAILSAGCLPAHAPRLLRLGFADGALATASDALAQSLARHIRARDVVLAPWRLDGHPDHEAVGHACAEVAALQGARLIEVPIWGWHWCAPDDARWPRARARRAILDSEAQARKQLALQAFRTQLLGDPSTHAAPILDADCIARARRHFEVLLV